MRRIHRNEQVPSGVEMEEAQEVLVQFHELLIKIWLVVFTFCINKLKNQLNDLEERWEMAHETILLPMHGSKS